MPSRTDKLWLCLLQPANEVTGRLCFQSCLSFSLCVCVFGGHPVWPLPMMHWNSPSRNPLPSPSLAPACMDLTIQGPSPSHMPDFTVQACPKPAPSPLYGTCPQTCSNLLNLDLTVHDPPPQDMFKLVELDQTCSTLFFMKHMDTVGKRVVGILLECFLGLPILRQHQGTKTCQ